MHRRVTLAPILLCALAARPAVAAVCAVTCEGPGPHDAPLSLALACAGPGGTVAVSGACVLERAVVINLSGQTLTGDCGASLSRELPAPTPGFLNPSAAVIVGPGASGSTIQDLVIRGAGDGISTSPISARVAAGQPDDIRILRCRVEAGVQYDGDAIHHAGMNGPPFNDVDLCSGLAAGISTGWIIDGNDLATARGSGIVHGGSDFTVTRNHIRATLHGIAARNQTRSLAVRPFGTPPSNHNNVYRGNAIVVVGNGYLPPGAAPVGLIDLGFTDTPEGPASADRCDRGFATLWENNCVDLTPDGGAGRDHVIAVSIAENGNSLGSVVVRENRFTERAPLVGASGGNVGVQTAGSRNAQVTDNVLAGAGDFAFLSLGADAAGNRYSGNKVGPGFLPVQHFVHDFGMAGSSCYARNDYCDTHEEFEGDGVDLACSVGNRAGVTCRGIEVHCPKAPAPPKCASSAKS